MLQRHLSLGRCNRKHFSAVVVFCFFWAIKFLATLIFIAQCLSSSSLWLLFYAPLVSSMPLLRAQVKVWRSSIGPGAAAQL